MTKANYNGYETKLNTLFESTDEYSADKNKNQLHVGK
jgi:hypothetical protein